MKKFILTIMVLVGTIALTFAQNDTVIYMANHPNFTDICLNRFDRVLVYGAENCQNYLWTVRYNSGYEQHPEGNPLVITGTFGDSYSVEYNGCGLWWDFSLHFTDDRGVPTSFTHEIWKHQGETIMLQAVQNVGDSTHYDFYWSTGEGGYGVWEIPISEPVVYTCQIPAMCGTAIRTFIVRDNVELYRVTVDLATNLNKVTWQTTEAQAEYISQVKVYRDGFFVGTAPYGNGYFLDAIGSDNAARNYYLVGVTTEDEDCPLASYEKGTIHTTYYLDVNDNLNMTWNIPYVEQGAQGSLTYFQICKYDPITEQLTVVDQVNSLITDYTCGVNQFAGGYPVIAAVFSNSKNRDFEDLSFSNMYTDIAIEPQEITISLTPGWTWISYPYAVAMNIATALGDFTPMQGDVIKSQRGSAIYRNGQWKGTISRFTPGYGYHYFSTRSEPATLVFDLSSSRAMMKP